jgi:hypothetical protein
MRAKDRGRGGFYLDGLALLCCAVLCCAVLCCAVLCCAVLCCALPRYECMLLGGSRDSGEFQGPGLRLVQI